MERPTAIGGDARPAAPTHDATTRETDPAAGADLDRSRRAKTLDDRFDDLAVRLTGALGSMPALIGSVILVVVWALSGPIFDFNDTWQLFINTTTTVITFWMVFVIQNAANRESKALQLKLDELIRAVSDARNEFMAVDREPREVLDHHERQFLGMAGHDDRDDADDEERA